MLSISISIITTYALVAIVLLMIGGVAMVSVDNKLSQMIRYTSRIDMEKAIMKTTVILVLIVHMSIFFSVQVVKEECNRKAEEINEIIDNTYEHMGLSSKSQYNSSTGIDAVDYTFKSIGNVIDSYQKGE